MNPNEPNPQRKGLHPALIVLLALFGLAFIGCGGVAVLAGDKAKSTNDTSKPGETDVKITSCVQSGNQFSGPKSTLEIKNSGDRAVTYYVEVKFTADNGAIQIDVVPVTVKDLAPGQTAKPEATSFKNGKRGDVQCVVSKVLKL